MNILQVFLAIFAFTGLAILMINIGFILRKREFRGGCASNNPMVADKFGSCPVCGKEADEACKMPEVEKARLHPSK
jgi:hypothetical protein